MENKSIRFIEMQAAVQNRIKVLNDLKYAEVFDVCEQFRSHDFKFPYSSKKKTIDGKTAYINISYNPDGDFSYYTCESCLCDGTLYFEVDCITKCLNKVLSCATTDDRVVFPRNCDIDINYIIGDLIVCNYTNDKALIPDKPYLKQTVAVYLPIQITAKEHVKKTLKLSRKPFKMAISKKSINTLNNLREKENN